MWNTPFTIVLFVFFLGKTFRDSKKVVKISKFNKQLEILGKISEKELELKELIQQLKSGTSTPPLMTLLDDLIEKLMQVSICLRDGTLSEENNPMLIFSERDFPTLKGFPVSFKIRDSRKVILDPQLAKVCKHLAKTLVIFKRQQSLSFLDSDFVIETKRFLNKTKKRAAWSHDEVLKFLFLIQEEFPSKKAKGIILRFLSWMNSFLWNDW